MTPASEMASLVSAIAKRDGLAFERLYNGTSAKIYGVVLRILRRHDLAAAVLEDAYLAALAAHRSGQEVREVVA